MIKNIGVAILGGTGYGAGELLRLFVAHPQVEVVSVVSSSKVGQEIACTHPHLQGFYDNRLVAGIDFDRLSNYEHKIVFVSLPHGVSSREVLALIDKVHESGVKLIDLSGDFRLHNEDIHLLHYPESPFAEEVRNLFVYGLPELNRKAIERTTLIANPGCLASACALATAPIIASGYTNSIVFDAKTGTSGAGRTPTEVTHHASRTSNFSAYKILSHRHEPEIQQALQLISETEIETLFVPHLLPTTRGIFVTAYFSFENELQTRGLAESAQSFYRHAPFVRYRTGSPELQHVIGTNFFDFSVVVRGRQVVVLGAVDNLVKGMAGMAIQNMNLLCGLPESVGLLTPSMGPL